MSFAGDDQDGGGDRSWLRRNVAAADVALTCLATFYVCFSVPFRIAFVPGFSVRTPEYAPWVACDYAVDAFFVLRWLVETATRCADDEDAVCERCVFGWTVANDVTARKLQKEHQQWFLGKSCDTFCPMSPWVIGADEQPWSALNGSRLETRVNGELRQTADVRDMIFSVATLIKTMSR